jgi:hypothetical protein
MVHNLIEKQLIYNGLPIEHKHLPIAFHLLWELPLIDPRKKFLIQSARTCFQNNPEGYTTTTQKGMFTKYADKGKFGMLL